MVGPRRRRSVVVEIERTSTTCAGAAGTSCAVARPRPPSAGGGLVLIAARRRVHDSGMGLIEEDARSCPPLPGDIGLPSSDSASRLRVNPAAVMAATREEREAVRADRRAPRCLRRHPRRAGAHHRRSVERARLRSSFSPFSLREDHDVAHRAHRLGPATCPGTGIDGDLAALAILSFADRCRWQWPLHFVQVLLAASAARFPAPSTARPSRARRRRSHRSHRQRQCAIIRCTSSPLRSMTSGCQEVVISGTVL